MNHRSTQSYWRYNDGGRSQYFKGNAQDCVTRAIAIATKRDYKDVYNTIKGLVGYTPREGIKNSDIKKVVEHFGGHWVACMKVGQGCKTHLKASELPNGSIVCRLSGHLVAVIDGMVNDTFDCLRGGTRCVYGYWTF